MGKKSEYYCPDCGHKKLEKWTADERKMAKRGINKNTTHSCGYCNSDFRIIEYMALGAGGGKVGWR